MLLWNHWPYYNTVEKNMRQNSLTTLYTDCPNKMLTLLTDFQKIGTWHFTGCLEQDLNFEMDFYLIEMRHSYQTFWWIYRRLCLKVCLVRFLHWNVHNNDFGLIFYVIKHILDRTKQILIIITFRSSGLKSNKLHFNLKLRIYSRHILK